MSFKAVNWTPNEEVAGPKMNQLGDNAEWLYQNTPRALYTLSGGIKRAQGIKIAAGRVMIPQNNKSDSASRTVRFGNFFSTRCQPIITTGIVSGKTRTFCVISGIGDNSLQPDHRGFQVGVNIVTEGKNANKKDHISSSFYISWQAMGY